MDACGLEVKTFLVMHDMSEAVQSSLRHEYAVGRECTVQRYPSSSGLAQCRRGLSIPRVGLAKDSSVPTPVRSITPCLCSMGISSIVAAVVTQSCGKEGSSRLGHKV